MRHASSYFCALFVLLATGGHEDARSQEIALQVEAVTTILVVGDTVQLEVSGLIDGVPSGDLTNEPSTVFTSVLPEIASVDEGG